MATVLKDLIERRVPHYLGIYLAAGWGVLEFTDYLVNRFVLSPHIADFALMAWALMMPSVILLAYFHGAPGRDVWTPVEKIGIPVNVLVAAGVLYAVFAGRELGAAMTEVVVEDETGQRIAREVPKGALRKRMALFYLNNASGDTALDWLQYAVPLGIENDLLQDIFIDVRTSYPYFHTRLKEAGYADGVGVPLPLQREIADELNLEHFVSGTVQGSPDSPVVTLDLHDARRGKRLQRRTYSALDLFELIDAATLQLKRDVGVPEQHIQDAPDLPFAELATSYRAAYRNWVEGLRAMESDEWSRAVEALGAAVEADPAFALAHWYRFSALLSVNEAAEANQALEAAMANAYKLPERLQFTLKANHYLIVKQDAEKAVRVAAMLTELFPEDVVGYGMLVQLYSNAGEREKAIAAAKKVLELDPGEIEMLRTIGSLYQQMGRYDEARTYFEEYAAEKPTEPTGSADLGDLSRAQGEQATALEHYERALLLDTDNVEVIVNVAQTHASLGQYDRAEEALQEAVEAAKTWSQRYQTHDAFRSYYRRRGQMERAVEAMHRSWEELEYGPPINALIAKLEDLDTYVEAGQPENARALLAEARAQLNPPFDLFLAIGQSSIAWALEDAEAIEGALAGMETLIEAFGFEVFRWVVVEGHARRLHIQGDCEGAIIAYRRVLELQPNNWGTYTYIGRCYRELGQLPQAEAELGEMLKRDPMDPEAHAELARVHTAAGRTDAAIAHYDTALVVWENASPEFEPARNAREELAALKG